MMAMPVAAPAQHAMGMPGAPGMGGVAQLHYWPGASVPGHEGSGIVKLRDLLV